MSIGISKDEARCYITLLKSGSLTANKIASQLGIFPNAVYRIMTRLEHKGFIVILNTSPRSYQSVPFDTALNRNYSLITTKYTKLKRTIDESFAGGGISNLQTNMHIIVGKERYFDEFIAQSRKASQEVLVISIGEPVADEIKLAIRDLLVKNIRVRMIFQKFNKGNESLLKSWIKMGCEVRHFSDSGYHVNIFDEKVSILAASNPDNSDERTATVIESVAVTKTLRTFFENLWTAATPI